MTRFRHTTRTLSFGLALTLLASASPLRSQTAPRAQPVTPTQPAGEELRSDPETSLIQYANYVYSQQQWNLAAGQFEGYLKRFPNGKDAPSAWYRLGECHLKQDQTDAAKEAYLGLIKRYTKGEYLAPAAYRLASLYYADRQFKNALPYFELAAKRSTKATIQLSATYYQARSLNNLGRAKETLATYQKVAEVETSNPYREAAMLSIARLHATAGDQNAALAAFVKLAAITTRDEIKGEALVKAGLLSSTLGDVDAAKAQLTAALELKGAEQWKPDAQFHLIKTYYSEGDYAKVTAVYRKGAFEMPGDLRPKMLLMVGNAYRLQKQYSDAIATYLLLREHYPASREASEAEYRKLLCFYNMRNNNLPEYVDDFILWQNARNRANKHIDMALLLKAEYLFTNGIFAPAGLAYDRIRIDNIPAELHASALYKRGWAHTEGENHTAAIRAFSDFLGAHPDDPRAASSLAKRALSYRALEDYTSALRDLDLIIKEHPESEAVELAYQQSALIRGQQRDYRGMVDSYTHLIEKFPSSKALPEAKFWIGWGQFELKDFAASSASLREARKLDPEAYTTRATLRIILAEYSQGKVAETRQEIESLALGSSVTVPPQVYLWLGVKLFDADDYADAAKYLNRASTPDQPETTQAVVWKYLGQARLYTGEYADAIKAFDHYLTSDQPPTSRARVLRDKAEALLELEFYTAADEIVEQALGLQPQSRVYGMLCLLWGEIALRQDQFETAIKRLVKPTYAIEDEEITPPALAKSALAHEKLGQLDKATELRQRLKKKFPTYKAPPTADATADTGTALQP